MPSFILRGLDPAFWARVQVKAAGEGIKIHALILRLLTAWLGVVLLVSSGCAYHAPTGPTPLPADLTSPATLTLEATLGAARTAALTATVRNRVGAPLAAIPITFSSDAGTVPAAALTDPAGVAHVTLIGPAGPARVTATAGTVTTSTLVALQGGSGSSGSTQDPSPTPSPPPPPEPLPLTVSIVSSTGVAGTATALGLSVSAPVASSVWDFGDTSPSVTSAGATTAHVYAAGSYTVAVVVTDTAGRTASARTALTIIPAPTPPPAPAPTLVGVITCTPPATHDPTALTPCNVAASYGSLPLASGLVTRVDWDWGDGTTTPNGGVVRTHLYATAGTYPVFATITATTVDGAKTTTATKTIPIL